MTIDEFVCRYFSLQQTALVDNMLYEDKHMDMYNYLQNLHMHNIELSDGTFAGTHQQLMAKKQEIQAKLERKKSLSLARDIELLETDRGRVRTVFEWYAVPYWIACHMIDNDEVVLSWRDCYWWGRCTIGKPLVLERSIAALYNTIGSASQ